MGIYVVACCSASIGILRSIKLYRTIAAIPSTKLIDCPSSCSAEINSWIFFNLNCVPHLDL